MKIGIIGAGNVGGTLGKGWAQKGHTVKFGVRDPAAPKLAALLAEAGANASAATVKDAVKFAEVVVLTVPWSAAQAAITEAGDLWQTVAGRHQPLETRPVRLRTRLNHFRQ